MLLDFDVESNSKFYMRSSIHLMTHNNLRADTFIAFGPKLLFFVITFIKVPIRSSFHSPLNLNYKPVYRVLNIATNDYVHSQRIYIYTSVYRVDKLRISNDSVRILHTFISKSIRMTIDKLNSMNNNLTQYSNIKMRNLRYF